MRLLFHFWLAPRPRTLLELGTRVISAGVFGGIVGAVLTVLVCAVIPHRLPYAQEIGISMLISAQFSLSFYFTCGLALQFLREQIQGLPLSFQRWVMAIGGAVGASLGFIIATWKLAFFPDLLLIDRRYYPAILIFEAISGAFIAIMIGGFQRLKIQLERVSAEKRQQEVLAARAQALALQAQIQPHFFFNTLNTISALIAIDPAAAQEAVGRLADMFRYALDSSQGELRTLEEELVFAGNYLRLEQARFSSRLRVVLPDEPVGDLRLPGLTLQPLVENAVRHGISKLVEGGTVEVALRRNGVSCELVVSNPMEGRLDPERLWRPGHALHNVRERLRLYDSTLAIEQTGDNVRVTIRLPIGKQA
jgi:hypothetical protein